MSVIFYLLHDDVARSSTIKSPAFDLGICPSQVSVEHCMCPPIMSIITAWEIQTNPPWHCRQCDWFCLSPRSHVVTPAQARISGSGGTAAAGATGCQCSNFFLHFK